LETSKHRGPQPIGDSIRAFLRDSGLGRSSTEVRVLEAWNAALDPGLRSRAPAVSFRQGVLTVEVASAALLQELRSFTGDTLKKKANATFPQPPIRKVVFKSKSS